MTLNAPHKGGFGRKKRRRGVLRARRAEEKPLRVKALAQVSAT